MKKQNININNDSSSDSIQNPYYASQLNKSQSIIANLESQLQQSNLSQAKKWALKKQIKTEKAKILRAKRKYESEVRSFEKGL